MNTGTSRVVFWTPRVLCLIFAIFLSLFALDVFAEGYGFWQTVAAFLIHMVPTYLVVLALIAAWRWEWVGAVLFSGLAVFYLLWAWGRFPFVAYLTISGPLFLIGLFFLINWLYKAEIRQSL